MKFFLPSVSEEALAQQIYEAVKRAAAKETGWTIGQDRVFALRYRMNDREFLAPVGIPHPPGPEAEVVVCIFRSAGFYLICTRNHGVTRNPPILVPRGRVSDVEFFNNVRDKII